MGTKFNNLIDAGDLMDTLVNRRNEARARIAAIEKDMWIIADWVRDETPYKEAVPSFIAMIKE